MRAVRRTTFGVPGPRGAGGYSIVEMLVGIGVAVVVGLGIYAVFTSTQRASISQKIYNDLQTSCNFAMDQMKTELQLAGYRAPKHANGSTYPISNLPAPPDPLPTYPNDPVQGAATITIEYYDDNASKDPPYASGYDNNTQVTYRLGGAPDYNLIREFRRHVPGGSYDNVHVTSQTLTTNVAALNFTYFKEGDALWDTGNPADIRTVRANLTCNASREDPNTKRTPQLALTAEVRARNIGVATVPTDTTPPATPTGLIAWDPGQCGTIELRWDANTEADLEGYTIFYGLAAGSYSDRLSITRAPKTAGSYEHHTVTGLDSAVTGVTPPPRYYFAISAYDKSGNVSPGLSAEASGDPTISARTAEEVATYGTDTTVNPRVPEAPAGFTATPGDNTVTLTWTKSTAAGLRGYRLYRGAAADFTPSDDAATGNRIANETALDQDAVSYTDAGLLGCTPYYYKLAAIACDTTITVAALQFADADASPTDATPPPTPTLSARSGFRRIILQTENPLLATTPDFVHTKVWFRLGAAFPVLNADGLTTDGTLIPDHGGVITGDGTVSINFDSETVENPGPPSLQRDETYSFLAVAYDRCGNHSDVTSAAQALGNQCGDGPVGPPSAPTGIDAEGCYDPMTLSWSGPDPIVHPDFFGYHVFRCDKSAHLCGYPCVNPSTSLAAPGWEEQTGAYIWQEQYTDTVFKGLQAGHSYAYCIQATDCYYEENRWTWPQPGDDAGNDPKDNFTETIITDPVAIGRVELDTGLPDAVSGYLLPSTSLLPFTTSVADGLTPLNPSFQHNTVTFWVKNTSAGTVTLQQLTPKWENAQAVLRKFAFGDGSTTPVTVGWDGSSVSGSPVTLTASQLLAGDEKIPSVALFRTAAGTVTRETDSRQQTVEFTLNYQNDSTGTSGCGLTESLYVPLGPYLYGTTQDQPAVGTRAWPIPGDQGSNTLNVIVANGGMRVTVYTNVFDSSGVGVAGVKLYYYVDSSRTLTAAPPVNLASLYPALPPYTAIDLTRVAGNQWRTPAGQGIPVSDGSNVWYFIVAVDAQGNFDRDPEADSGAFEYYQQPADICGTTPLAPATLSGSVSGGNVTLTWSAPAANTNGAAYTDGKGFKVYRDSGTGWTPLATINDKNALTHTDAAVPDIGTLTYRYYVTAFDLCTPTPNQSAGSPIYTESLEDACNSTPNPPVLSGATDAAGGSVTLTWTAPSANTSGSALTDLGGYRIWRKTGTGSWTDLGTVGSAVTTYTDSGLASIGTVDYSYYVLAYDTCAPTPKESASSNIYVDQSVTTNPCDTQPGTPSDLTATQVNSTVGVVLTWKAPETQYDPAGWPYNDPGGFKIWRAEYDASGTYTGVSGVVATVSAATTTWQDTSVAATVGTMIYRYWVIAFDTCNNSSPSWLGPYMETYSDPCASVPGAPTGLSVTAADDTGVSLSWSAPSPNPGDIDGYVIEHKNGATGSWVPIVGSPLYGGATSIKDPVTDAATAVYFYRVKAFDTCATPNSSAWSSVAQETYNPCATFPVPSQPTGFTAVANGKCRSANSPYAPVTTRADLDWTATTAPPSSPAGVTVSHAISVCDTAGCTPATAATVVSGPSHGSGANVNNWDATVELGAFLALQPYTFGVQQVYTKGSCVTRSTMATATELCQ